MKELTGPILSWSDGSSLEIISMICCGTRHIWLAFCLSCFAVITWVFTVTLPHEWVTATLWNFDNDGTHFDGLSQAPDAMRSCGEVCKMKKRGVKRRLLKAGKEEKNQSLEGTKAVAIVYTEPTKRVYTGGLTNLHTQEESVTRINTQSQKYIDSQTLPTKRTYTANTTKKILHSNGIPLQQGSSSSSPKCCYEEISGKLDAPSITDKTYLQDCKSCASCDIDSMQDCRTSRTCNAGYLADCRNGCNFTQVMATWWKKSYVPKLNMCERGWSSMLADRMACFHFTKFVVNEMHSMQRNAKQRNAPQSFMYRPDLPRLRRILLLGDSVSRGVTYEIWRTYGSLANIHEAPENCYGFSTYTAANVALWLGSCPWDLIQFQIGAHVHNETGLQTYEKQLRNVVTLLRDLAPSAVIVFAATTPSPFDSSLTRPERSTCKNYDRLHSEGYVPKLNSIARKVMLQLNVTFNDRYSVVHPQLNRFQRSCDIHFETNGLRKLAVHDWSEFSRLLELPATPK